MAQATISISNAQVQEGNTGTRNMAFTITRSGLTPFPVTGRFSTGPTVFNPATVGTTCGGNVDFIRQTNRPFVIPANARSVRINVPICGDTAFGPNETFVVRLNNLVGAQCNPSNACIGRGTILNDDPRPRIAINDITVREPSNLTATATASFTVRLDRRSEAAVTVNFTTRNGTAASAFVCDSAAFPPGSVDYARTAGTLTFNPGTLALTINVPICFDSVPEPNQTFFVDLTSPVNATILDGTGAGIIRDANAL